MARRRKKVKDREKHIRWDDVDLDDDDEPDCDECYDAGRVDVYHYKCKDCREREEVGEDPCGCLWVECPECS